MSVQHKASSPQIQRTIELQMAVAKRDHRIEALEKQCLYLKGHYLALVSECAGLYRMSGVQYAVSILDSDATHRLPESVMHDIRQALKVST